MTSSSQERAAVWDAFLQKWPLESLPNLTLAQYSTAGDKDCFTQWLESKTEELGSIWGGSSFKFGVYSRKDQSDKVDGEGRRFTAAYAWMAKYGDTPDEAFATVRSILVNIANAARQGNLSVVEAADLGTVTKWKVAFLYQDRANPCVLPAYKLDSLRSLAGNQELPTAAAMHARLLERRGDTDLLTYGLVRYGLTSRLSNRRLTTEQLHDYLKTLDGFAPVKAATDKMAGFEALPVLK